MRPSPPSSCRPDQVVHGARVVARCAARRLERVGLVESGAPIRLATVGRPGLGRLRSGARDFQRYGASHRALARDQSAARRARRGGVDGRAATSIGSAATRSALRQSAARLSVGADPLRSRRRCCDAARLVGSAGSSGSTALSIRRRCTIPASAADCATTRASAPRSKCRRRSARCSRVEWGYGLPRRQQRRHAGHAGRSVSAATRCSD